MFAGGSGGGTDFFGDFAAEGMSTFLFSKITRGGVIFAEIGRLF